jgi:thiol-disulfide isomerase/thioredoxin
MKLIKVMIGLLVMSIVLNACQKSTNNAVLYTKIHPKKSLNQELNNVDFQNKFTLIDFWATWCAPCIKGFDHLNELATNSDLSEKYNFIIISDEAEDKVSKRLSGRELKVISLIDSLNPKKNDCGFRGKTFSEFGICALPTAVILNNKGEEVWKGQARNLTVQNLKNLYQGKSMTSNENDTNKTPSKESSPTVTDTVKTKNYIFVSKRELEESNRSSTSADFSRFGVKGHPAKELLMKITGLNDYKFMIDESLSNNYFSIKYQNKSDAFTEEEHRRKVKELVLAQFNLKMDTVQLQKTFKTLKISDIDKLVQAKSIESDKSYHSGYDYDTEESKGVIVLINSKLEVLVKILNDYFEVPFIISDDYTDQTKYDFEIPYNRKEDILRILEDDYGLSFSQNEKEITVYNISKSEY